MVSTPRPDGQPKLASIAMNNNNIDKPVTASGITKGALATRLKNNLPLKSAKRTKAIAINNPNIVEIVAELNPISNDLNAMRPSTFPNLLSAINSNISRLYTSGKLFEVGPNFQGINDNEQNKSLELGPCQYLLLWHQSL